jgi:hypothetical protein
MHGAYTGRRKKEDCSYTFTAPSIAGQQFPEQVVLGSQCVGSLFEVRDVLAHSPREK